jgi:hypothetical protein
MGLRRFNRPQTPWDFPYRFLPEISAEDGQIGRNRGAKRLKLRKTLHLADTIGGGKRIQETPPPGTKTFTTAAIDDSRKAVSSRAFLSNLAQINLQQTIINKTLICISHFRLFTSIDGDGAIVEAGCMGTLLRSA